MILEEISEMKNGISKLSSMQDELLEKFNKKIEDFNILSVLKNELTTLTEKIEEFNQKDADVKKYFDEVEKDKKELNKEITKYDKQIEQKEDPSKGKAKYRIEPKEKMSMRIEANVIKENYESEPNGIERNLYLQ